MNSSQRNYYLVKRIFEQSTCGADQGPQGEPIYMHMQLSEIRAMSGALLDGECMCEQADRTAPIRHNLCNKWIVQRVGRMQDEV